MNALVGATAVMVSLAAALVGIAMLVVGIRQGRPRLLESGARYGWVMLAGMLVATVAMQRALITRDFGVLFVAEQGSSRTPPLFNVATMWSALEGSILLWGLILACYIAIIIHKFRDRLTDPLVAWAAIVLFTVAAFFFALMVGPADPFVSFDPPPGYDGPGPNPLLQKHILDALHPHML